MPEDNRVASPGTPKIAEFNREQIAPLFKAVQDAVLSVDCRGFEDISWDSSQRCRAGNTRGQTAAEALLGCCLRSEETQRFLGAVIYRL